VILHITWSLDVGGGEVFLSALTRALARRGRIQRVFTIGPRGRLADEVEAAGVPVTAFHKRSRAGLWTTARIAGAVRELRPALVHTHGEGGLFWGAPAAWLARVPVVSLLYQHHETWIKQLTARTALRIPATVIAGSHAIASYVHDHLGVRRERLMMIHCGIEPAAFSPRPERRLEASRGPVLVSVGRLVASKGHRILIEAFAQLRETWPRAELIIVGDGPERSALEHQTAVLGLTNAVRFPGTVYPTAGVLSRADVFVFPSLNEPQGLALLEAFAAGVPVVASRTGGIPEMLTHEVHGLLVEPGRAPAIVAAVGRLIADNALREACVARARDRLRAFDVDILAAQYDALYQQQ
jgi:glycosyltransferase involved in cell wall biosynthesis